MNSDEGAKRGVCIKAAHKVAKKQGFTIKDMEFYHIYLKIYNTLTAFEEPTDDRITSIWRGAALNMAIVDGDMDKLLINMRNNFSVIKLLQSIDIKELQKSVKYEG